MKEKISEFHTGRERPPESEETRRKKSVASKKNWQDPEYREKVVSAVTEAVNTSEMRKLRNENQKARWADPEIRPKLLEALSSIPNRMSGLHIEVREYLDLDSCGFVSEQPVAGYIVDELNEEAGIVIEVNGDYVHANPDHYDAEDVIRLPGRSNSYTASEKWEADAEKIKTLEEEGYTVIVIWESDDWEKSVADYIK